jgi:hypothetical protein
MRGCGDAGMRGCGDAGTRGRGDVGTRGRGDAGTRGIRRVASSPHRPVAASPHRPVAPSPHRRVAASPRRLVALLVILFALSGCAAPVRVEWSTETEMNTAGFNLYRGESADGPFDVKVNEQLIAPAADPLTGGKYQYVDKTARAGVTYYYRLEEVERNGSANNFGPISVRAGGLEWWHVLILVSLAAVVVALWLLGGRREARKQSRRVIKDGEESSP